MANEPAMQRQSERMNLSAVTFVPRARPSAERRGAPQQPEEGWVLRINSGELQQDPVAAFGCE